MLNETIKEQVSSTVYIWVFLKEVMMGYTKVALEDKILEMYPEIKEIGIAVSLNFDDSKNAYIVRFKKDDHELTTHLEKKDADECMNNIKCVYLGVQVEQFIKNFDTQEEGA
jgi:hypothetical protein